MDRNSKFLERFLHSPEIDIQKAENFLSNERLVANYLRLLKNLYKIICFSETHKSNLMWSHYTDSHKGYCIEYDCSKYPINTQETLYKIKYEKNKPDITKQIEDEDMEAFASALMTKAIDWEYEKEWRLITTIDDDDFIQDNNAITSIYLGVNCNKEIKKDIIQWAIENNKNAIQMKVNITKYELDEDYIVKDGMILYGQL